MRWAHWALGDRVGIFKAILNEFLRAPGLDRGGI